MSNREPLHPCNYSEVDDLILSYKARLELLRRSAGKLTVVDRTWILKKATNPIIYQISRRRCNDIQLMLEISGAAENISKMYYSAYNNIFTFADTALCPTLTLKYYSTHQYYFLIS